MRRKPYLVFTLIPLILIIGLWNSQKYGRADENGGGLELQQCLIMPVGDSITAGIGSTDDEYGYRVPLYNALDALGYLPQFVGTQDGGSGVIPTNLDKHEGYPGNATDFFEQRIYNLLTQNPADIILLHLGTNDISSNDVDPNDDLAVVLDEIDRYEQDNSVTIPVIVAQIINRACPTTGNCSTKATQTTTYNQNVATLIQNRISSGDTLILVDMENDAGLNYTFNGPDFAPNDSLHPNDSGYTKIASLWQSELEVFCDKIHNTYIPFVQK